MQVLKEEAEEVKAELRSQVDVSTMQKTWDKLMHSACSLICLPERCIKDRCYVVYVTESDVYVCIMKFFNV